MAIRPTFKIQDVEKYIERRLKIIEDEMVERMSELGERCVAMSRDSLNISASAFPIKYGKGEKSPLRQRKITARDIAKNPAAKPPKFGDYLDQTSNLRNSIGYAIIKDGKVLISALGSAASSEAKRTVQQYANSSRKGISLVVVAGQGYAAFVESRGYNVISSAEHFAKSEMPKLVADLKRSVGRKK